MCYAELSTTCPESGGDYIYLRRAYGQLIAFLYAWTELVIIRTGSIAAISFLFAGYACNLFAMDISATKIFAIGIILILTAFNLTGLYLGSKLQNILSLTKLLSLILLILAGLFSTKGNLSQVINFKHIDLNPSLYSSFALALIPILWTYGGWQENVFLAGETKDTKRSLPFALLGTVLVISVIYLLVNVSFLYIIPAEQMKNSSLVAADALNIIYGGFSAKLFDILVILCSIGTINAMIIAGSRIAYAVGTDLSAFKLLKITTHDKTPVIALLLNSLGACIFVILGSFDRLLFFTGIAVWIFFALVVSSLFIFRKRYANNTNRFLVPFYPWLPCFFILVCLMLCANILFTYVEQSLYGLLLISTGVPVFYVSKYLTDKNILKEKLDDH